MCLKLKAHNIPIALLPVSCITALERQICKGYTWKPFRIVPTRSCGVASAGRTSVMVFVLLQLRIALWFWSSVDASASSRGLYSRLIFPYLKKPYLYWFHVTETTNKSYKSETDFMIFFLIFGVVCRQLVIVRPSDRHHIICDIVGQVCLANVKWSKYESGMS